MLGFAFVTVFLRTVSAIFQFFIPDSGEDSVVIILFDNF
jgi:hypothetical protein